MLKYNVHVSFLFCIAIKFITKLLIICSFLLPQCLPLPTVKVDLNHDSNLLLYIDLYSLWLNYTNSSFQFIFYVYSLLIAGLSNYLLPKTLRHLFKYKTFGFDQVCHKLQQVTDCIVLNIKETSLAKMFMYNLQCKGENRIYYQRRNHNF